jgi:hypothetical protein
MKKAKFHGGIGKALSIGLFVLVLLATGCPNDSGDTDAFEGTWIGTGKEAGHTMIAANGSYSEYRDVDNLNFMNGTYSIAGNTVTMKMVEINPAILGGQNGMVKFDDLDDGSKAYLENSDTFIITIQGESLLDDEGEVGFTRKK